MLKIAWWGKQMSFCNVPDIRYRKVSMICKCKLEWLAIWAHIFNSRCENKISPWTKCNSQTKFIAASYEQWTWLVQWGGVMNIVILFIWHSNYTIQSRCWPMWPDLQILLRRLEYQVNMTVGSSNWKRRWTFINTPESVPCKSMLFKNSMAT